MSHPFVRYVLYEYVVSDVDRCFPVLRHVHDCEEGKLVHSRCAGLHSPRSVRRWPLQQRLRSLEDLYELSVAELREAATFVGMPKGHEALCTERKSFNAADDNGRACCDGLAASERSACREPSKLPPAPYYQMASLGGVDATGVVAVAAAAKVKVTQELGPRRRTRVPYLTVRGSPTLRCGVHRNKVILSYFRLQGLGL